MWPSKSLRSRCAARDLRGQDGQLGPRLAHRDARFETANDGDRVAPAVGFLAEGKGKIQIDVAAGSEDRGEIERRRQHADHGDRLIVDNERAADKSGVGAEAPRPEAVAQQHSLGPVPFAFLGIEQAAELRLDPEHLKEIPGNRHAAEPLRLAIAAEQIVAHARRRRSKPPGRNRNELRARNSSRIIDLGGRAGKAAGIVIGDPDQLPRIAEGQRPNEHAR